MRLTIQNLESEGWGWCLVDLDTDSILEDGMTLGQANEALKMEELSQRHGEFWYEHCEGSWLGDLI